VYRVCLNADVRLLEFEKSLVPLSATILPDLKSEGTVVRGEHLLCRRVEICVKEAKLWAKSVDIYQRDESAIGVDWIWIAFIACVKEEPPFHRGSHRSEEPSLKGCS
jgi:hypothetical protein